MTLSSAASPRDPREPQPSHAQEAAPPSPGVDAAQVLHALPSLVPPALAPPALSPSGPGTQDYFDQQPTPRSALPDPEPLVTNLARCVIEILAGAREIEQIARWVTDEVYRHLLKRVVLAVRARNAKGTTPLRPAFTVGSVVLTEPSDGVVEAVVIMHGRVRSRAVALRLEGLDNRWRATAVHVL